MSQKLTDDEQIDDADVLQPQWCVMTHQNKHDGGKR